MKPILFSTTMVQALLNTAPCVWPAEPIDASKPCKSQTRRVVEDQPPYGFFRYDGLWSEEDDGDGCHYFEQLLSNGKPTEMYWKVGNPKYKVGDILYVREAWQENTMHSEGDRRDIPYLYKADPDGVLLRSWKPSIHMPREAARLFLEVKSVRVERVQDISTIDSIAEGCEMVFGTKRQKYDNNHITIGVASFAYFWDSINAKRGYSWESNPWVFVYEFMRVENDN